MSERERGEAPAEGATPMPLSLFEKLAEKLGGAARAATIYGEAVERDGVTVIPVAKARWGVGGGGGHRRHGANEGIGAGGGVIVRPVGYIEIRQGRSRYRPIWDPVIWVGLASMAGSLVLFALRRAFRKGER